MAINNISITKPIFEPGELENLKGLSSEVDNLKSEIDTKYNKLRSDFEGMHNQYIINNLDLKNEMLDKLGMLQTSMYQGLNELDHKIIDTIKRYIIPMNITTMQTIIRSSKCKVTNFNLDHIDCIYNGIESKNAYVNITILTNKSKMVFSIIYDSMSGYDYETLMKYVKNEKVYIKDIWTDTDSKGNKMIKIYLKYKKLFKNIGDIITIKGINGISINML